MGGIAGPGRPSGLGGAAESWGRVWATICASTPDDWAFYEDGLTVYGGSGRIRIRLRLGGADFEDWWTAAFSEAHLFGYEVWSGFELIEYVPMAMLDEGRVEMPLPGPNGKIAARHLFLARLLGRRDPDEHIDSMRRAGLTVEA